MQLLGGPRDWGGMAPPVQAGGRQLATAALRLVLPRHPALPSLQVLLQLLSPLPGGRHCRMQGGPGPLRCNRVRTGLRSMTHRSVSGLRIPAGRDLRGKQFMMRVPAGRAVAQPTRACHLTYKGRSYGSHQASSLCRLPYAMPEQPTSLLAQAWCGTSTWQLLFHQLPSRSPTPSKAAATLTARAERGTGY